MTEASESHYFDLVRQSVRRESVHLESVLRRFNPLVGAKSGRGKKSYPERFVSHFYIRALARAIGSASVVLEVPLWDSDKTRVDNHLDALIFSQDVAILAEFKRVNGNHRWLEVIQDRDRLWRQFSDVVSRFEERSRPKLIFGFYGMDTWKRYVVEAWKGEQALPEGLQNLKLRDSVSVNDTEGYCFFFGFEDLQTGARS